MPTKAKGHRLTNEDRRPLHCYLDPSSWDAFNDLTAKHGVTKASFIEGLARMAKDDRLPKALVDQVVAEARGVFNERKSREGHRR